MEGAWKNAMDHFSKMAGTQLSQFEAHMAEIIRLSEAKGNLYNSFFNLLRSVNTRHRPVEYRFTTPLFDSWNVQHTDTPITEWSTEPTYSDVESEASFHSDTEVAKGAAVIITSDDRDSNIPLNLLVEMPVQSPLPTSIQCSCQQLVMTVKSHRTYPLFPCHQLIQRLVK